MDPVTAIGLLSGIMSIIGHCSHIISNTREIYASASGQLEETKRQEAEIETLQRLCLRLNQSVRSAEDGDGDFEPLCALAEECETLCKRMIKIIERRKVKNKSRINSFASALRHTLGASKMAKLERQVRGFRKRLEAELASLAR